MTSVLFCSLNLKLETEATKRQKNQVRSWSYYLTDFYMHLSELKSFNYFHSDLITIREISEKHNLSDFTYF